MINAKGQSEMPAGSTINLPDGCWEELVSSGAAERVELDLKTGTGNSLLGIPHKK